LAGFISQGIALCGKMLFRKAMKAFDLAFMFTDGDSRTIHLLLLVKACQYFIVYPQLHYGFQAVSLFNSNRQQEAMLRIQELAAACPNADTFSCRVIKVSIVRNQASFIDHFPVFRISGLSTCPTGNQCPG
jgi:hypothetical protein